MIIFKVSKKSPKRKDKPMTSQTLTRSHSIPGARTAMKEAWRVARRGQAVFGGSLRSYLAEALRIAWAELKADPVFQECQIIIGEIRARQARLGGRHAAPSRFVHRAYGGAWIGA